MPVLGSADWQAGRVLDGCLDSWMGALGITAVTLVAAGRLEGPVEFAVAVVAFGAPRLDFRRIQGT